MLSKNIILSKSNGVIGYHPTSLPKNRGRHPVIWALALGLKEISSTFFLMDQGADTGPILSQENISITYEDDAGTLYDKLILVGISQIEEILKQFCNGVANPRPKTTVYHLSGENDHLRME